MYLPYIMYRHINMYEIGHKEQEFISREDVYEKEGHGKTDCGISAGIHFGIFRKSADRRGFLDGKRV